MKEQSNPDSLAIQAAGVQLASEALAIGLSLGVQNEEEFKKLMQSLQEEINPIREQLPLTQ